MCTCRRTSFAPRAQPGRSRTQRGVGRRRVRRVGPQRKTGRGPACALRAQKLIVPEACWSIAVAQRGEAANGGLQRSDGTFAQLWTSDAGRRDGTGFQARASANGRPTATAGRQNLSPKSCRPYAVSERTTT